MMVTNFWNDFGRGMKDAFPVVVSYLPIAAGFGLLGIQSGLSFEECVFMSALVFAGASQFVALGMIASGIGVMQIVIGTLFLNLRHLIMAVSLKSRTHQSGRDLTRFAPFFLTDETYALAMGNKKLNQAYYMGVSLFSYTSWVIGTGLGSFFYDYVPSNLTENIVVILYLLFITILVPMVKISYLALFACGLSAVLNLAMQNYFDDGWAIVASIMIAAVITAQIARRKHGTQSN